MADTESIFYKIGLKARDSLGTAVTDLKGAHNTWTGTNDFEKAVTVAYGGGTALDIKGTASTSGKLTANSLTSTGDTDAKGDLSVTGNLTVSKDLTIEGNLVVNGTEAIVDAVSLDVTDNILKLSDGASGGSYAKDSGLYFERGAGKSASAFVFDESEESFVVGTLEGSGSIGTTYSMNSNVVYNADASGNVTSVELTNNSQGTKTGYPSAGATFTKAHALNKNFAPVYTFSGGQFSMVMGISGDTGNNELLQINLTLGSTTGSGAVKHQYASYVAPSGSNADIANTTPAPLTVGSLKLTNVVSGATCSFGKFAITIGGPIVAGRLGVSVMPTNTQGFNSAWPTTGEFYENTTGNLYYLPKSGDTYNDMVAAAGRFTPHPSGTHWDDATITVTLIGNVGDDSPFTDYTATSGTALSFTANQIVYQELGDLVDFDAGYDA